MRLILLTLAVALARNGVAAAQTAMPTTLPVADHPLSVRFDPVYSIGVADGQPWEMLTDVISVAFDTTGRLFVLERAGVRLLMFGPDGRFISTIGRRGPGPGELQGPAGLAVTSDGRLAVADGARQAITLFSTTGTYLGSVPVGQGIRALYPSMRADASGGILLVETATSRRDPERLAIYRHSLNPNESARIYLELPRSDSAGGAAVSGTVMRRVLPPVFSPTLRFVPWGKGLAAASGTAYRVIVGGSGGAAEIRRAIHPRTVTSGDQEAARERRRHRAGAINRSQVPGSGFSTVEPTGAALEAELRQMTFAREMPVISGLGADPAGRLWVARTPLVAFGPTPIDILSADRRYLGTIASAVLPFAFGPNGLVASIEIGEDDVERVVVRRIVGLP